MTTTELATIDVPEVVLSSNDLELIRRQINVGNSRPPTDEEIDGFGRYCMAQRLNPFDRQIYLANIGGRWQPFTGVHGRLVIALRTGEVEGMEGPYYCRKREGVERDQPPHWDELWDDDSPPHAAKFVVYRKGWTRHPVGIAPWRYYNKGSGTWKTNPPLMLGYKAITRALNLVFPDVMPPAPDRSGDDPDIDESAGYVRADVPPPPMDTGYVTVTEPRADSGAYIDARSLLTESGLTQSALLVQLRRVAIDNNLEPPTKLDAIDAALVDLWRGAEEPY